MKTVIVRPERCVACLQCRFACAVVHSQTQSPYAAPYESVLSKPRIHIGVAGQGEPFPNKCRHCDPAPCELSCPTRAIYRGTPSHIVLIEPQQCINCGMCAMACPFGVIRYHLYPTKKASAHKCDQCIERQREDKIPACVEVCKVRALLFDDINKYMDTETGHIASLVYLGIREKERMEDPYSALKIYKSSLQEIKGGGRS